MHVRLFMLMIAFVGGCGSGDEANRRGVGAECTADNDCTETGQHCLTQFKGGYCGIAACMHDADCPSGSACITEESGVNYCFLTCVEKVDCNGNRSVENESNCVASLTFVDGAKGLKVCRPPLGNLAAP